MRTLRPSSALAVLACAGTLALSAQAPAASPAAERWCTGIPLPAGARASACRALEIRTARGTLRLAVAGDDDEGDALRLRILQSPACLCPRT